MFIGSSDPNPLVAGRGAGQLRQAGVEVVEGLLKEECDALNPIFSTIYKLNARMC
ncbi:riboflavin biosynthesis protein [Actinobacillus equuli]|nr:riboflavin biosynthesis protein [Actinobacillus equuli]